MLTNEQFNDLLNANLAGDHASIQTFHLRCFVQKELTHEQEASLLSHLEPLLKNNPHAMMLKGTLYLLGLGCQQNVSAAIVLYDKAIPLEESQAMTYRAVMYLEGTGCDKDLSKAIELLERAIKLGNAQAMLKRALIHLKDKNFDAAIALLDKAIALEHPQSMYERAYMHQYGIGGPTDPIAAVALYDRAAALEYAQAKYIRALLHRAAAAGLQNNAAVAVLHGQAATLFGQAAALGHVEAMYYRASMYEDGRGSAKNFPKAILLHQQAAALGGVSSKARLSQLKQAAALGSVSSKTRLFHPAKKGDIAPLNQFYAENFLLPVMTIAKGKHQPGSLIAKLPNEIIENIIEFLGILVAKEELGSYFDNKGERSIVPRYKRIANSVASQYHKKEIHEILGLIHLAIANETYWQSIMPNKEEPACILAMRACFASREGYPTVFEKLATLQDIARDAAQSELVPEEARPFCQLILNPNKESLAEFIQAQASTSARLSWAFDFNI